jgi:hypothetical protein
MVGVAAPPDATRRRARLSAGAPVYDRMMLTKHFHRAGARAWQMQILSLGSVGLCVGLWIRAKTVDQDERGNAERRALFVGLWPPMIWLIGESLQRYE